MDQLYDQLFNKETLILAFIVVIGTFFVRRIVETAVPSCKDVATNGDSKYKTKFGLWWNSVILYAVPVALGAALAIWAYKAEALPGEFKTIPGAAMWGAVVGWCSSFIYKVVRKFLKKKTGVDLTPGPAEPDKKLDEDKDESDDEEDEPPKKKRQPTKKKDESDDEEETKDED